MLAAFHFIESFFQDLSDVFSMQSVPQQVAGSVARTFRLRWYVKLFRATTLLA
jgi:hypothetical protein